MEQNILETEDQEDTTNAAYIERTDARHREYVSEYEKWIAGMTPEERAEAARLGVLEAADPVHAPALDVVDTEKRPTLAAEGPQDPTQGEGAGLQSPELAEFDGGSTEIFDVVRRLVGELIKTSDRAFSLDCLALATGLAFEGATMTEIGRKHGGRSRAAVSKRCIELCERIGLPPSRVMRSLEAREVYAEAQHSRKFSVKNHLLRKRA